MRIILKPGGVLILIGTLATLATLVVLRDGKTRPLGLFPAQEAVASSGTDGASPLLANGDFSQDLANSWLFRGAPAIVKRPGPDGTQQYLHQHVVPGKNAWDVYLGQAITKPLKIGDHVVFRGWFRSPQSLPIHFYVEETGDPHTKTVSAHIDSTPEWTERSVVGTIKRDFNPGEAQLMIHFGVIPGDVDVADFHLDNYGPDMSFTSSYTTRRKIKFTYSD